MISRIETTRLLLQTIGCPIGTGSVTPDPGMIDELAPYAFRNRVGLLFLEVCVSRGVKLGDVAEEMYQSLTARRKATDQVVVKLAKRLDEVARDEWVLFKSIKPFPSTPNDTDWFPLDSRRHKELCEHLLADGQFKLLEVAPRQTTLIEAGGDSITDTTKRGGIYYVDCYMFPSTDYFVYFDSARLRKHLQHTTVAGYEVPILAPHAELAAIMFHNVFPERSFSVESYYLIKTYLDSVEREHTLDDFVAICREHKMELAAAANLSATSEIDLTHFGAVDGRIVKLLTDLGTSPVRLRGFDANGALPYEFSNRVFWSVFALKQRDPVALRSSIVQALHMLNPVFFVDVLKVIWKRSVRGGVYEQH